MTDRTEYQRVYYQNERRHRTGRPIIVSAEPARLHIKALSKRGMSYAAFARAAGINRVRSVQEIACGYRTRGILNTTEERLLAVEFSPSTFPAVGLIRRVRALVAIGYNIDHIAAESGVCDCVISRLRRGIGQHATLPIGIALAEAYERLCMSPVEGWVAGKQRRWARKNGWAPPLAWDDIDNPKARPLGITRDSRTRRGVDEVAIQRRMAGDRSVNVHGEESAEVVRRLFAAGYSSGWIEEQTGLKADRYVHVTKKEEAA